MKFNFDTDHSEIDSLPIDTIDSKYLREFYLRLNSRGIYANQICDRALYQSIEDYLNSKNTLTTLCCNTILNTNSENFIQNSLKLVPKHLYEPLLKSSLYTMNDLAIHYIIESWPFESLDIARYFFEAYSSLLLFYNTDTNSYTGKIASDILKWLYIGSKYAKMITCLFLKNQANSDYKLRILDLTGLPLSNNLVKKLLNRELDFGNEDSDTSNLSDLDDVSDFFSSEDDQTDSWSDCSEMDSQDEPFSMDSSYSELHFSKINKSSLYWEKKSLIKLDIILPCSNLKETFVKSIQNKNHTVNLEIKFNKLDLTIRDKKCCIMDNENFNSHALKINGLGIFFSANLNEAMYTFNLVNKFSNIQELNLSAFGQESLLSSLLDKTHALNTLSDCFAELKQLKRLRLNIPGCKHRLGFILKNLASPLEYLNLTSCGLVEQDLDFLAGSIHTSTINNLVLSNNDLNNQCDALIRLLKKMKFNIQVLDLGCNSFQFDVYFKIVNEVIVQMSNLRMLVTLDVFKFDNYLKLAEKLSLLGKFVSWRINYSSDYYEKSAKIKNRYKFKKFKQDYIEALERRLATTNGSRSVKITINDPDLNFILNEIF